MHITVVGTGYVGLVTGTCLADMGNDVWCHDVDNSKIAMLERGEMPIYEPGLAELVRRNLRDGRLRFTTNLTEAVRGAQVCFIAVGTPPDEDGSADRRHVLMAAASVVDAADGPLVIVVKSTVPVGTCDEVRAIVDERLTTRKEDWHFEVVSNPEFLKEGKAVEDFMRPDRIVVGTSSESASELMKSLYEPYV
ncbi:nucleotide sugar dehydrogenase, partial [Myxococcota bacterium]